MCVYVCVSVSVCVCVCLCLSGCVPVYLPYLSRPLSRPLSTSLDLSTSGPIDLPFHQQVEVHASAASLTICAKHWNLQHHPVNISLFWNGRCHSHLHPPRKCKEALGGRGVSCHKRHMVHKHSHTRVCVRVPAVCTSLDLSLDLCEAATHGIRGDIVLLGYSRDGGVDSLQKRVVDTVCHRVNAL